MELFPAADDDAWTLIQRVIESSDYYLLVVGGRYGTIDAESEISFTEKEFDYAVSLNKPILAFLHADPDAIELGKSEKDEAARQQLARFRTKVETTKHVKYWMSPDDLSGKVALSYASFRQTYPAVGWVRGDVQTSTESLTEINDLRKKLETAERRLASARSSPPPGTQGLAQGDDVVDFVAGTTVNVKTVQDPFGVTLNGSFPIDVSWDEMFSALGPELLNEASQRLVESRVDVWLTQEFGPQLRKKTREQLREQDKTFVGFTKVSIWLSDDDFGTVLVQLRALGLITKSDRKRSVRDRGTYWTLTPYGDEHLTTLRAIKKNARLPRAGGGTTAADEGSSN